MVIILIRLKKNMLKTQILIHYISTRLMVKIAIAILITDMIYQAVKSKAKNMKFRNQVIILPNKTKFIIFKLAKVKKFLID